MQKSKSLLIKVLTFICAVCCVLALAFGLTACADGADGRGIASATINEKGELVITYTDDTTQTLDVVKGATGDKGDKGDKGDTGAQGPAGEQGPAGANGTNGTNGENGKTPTVEINSDGYWVINGEVTTVKAAGQDGTNGTNGENGVTPTVEINDDGYWVINGEVTTVKAAGTNGTNGENGASIASITSYTKDGKVYLTVTLTNGEKLDDVELTLPENVGGSTGSAYVPEVCPNDEDGEHDYELVVTVVEPTETTVGRGVYVCKHNCGSAIFGEIETIPHSWKLHNSTELDDYNVCVTDYYEWYQCENVDKAVATWADLEKYLSAAELAKITDFDEETGHFNFKKALGHNWAVELDDDGEPVLDKDGNTIEKLSENPYLDLDGNALNICENGYQLLAVCLRCGETESHKDVPAQGHAVDKDWIKASEVSSTAENYDATKVDPTMEKSGYIYGYCDVCGEYHYVEVPAFEVATGEDNANDIFASNADSAYYVEDVKSEWKTCTDHGIYYYVLTVEYTYKDADGKEQTETLELSYLYEILPHLHYIIWEDGTVEYIFDNAYGLVAITEEEYNARIADEQDAWKGSTVAGLNGAYYRPATDADDESVIEYAVYDYETYKDYMFFTTNNGQEYNCEDQAFGWFYCEGPHVDDNTHGVTTVWLKGSHVVPEATKNVELKELVKEEDLAAVKALLTPAEGKNEVLTSTIEEVIKTYIGTDKTDYVYVVANTNDEIGFTFWICEKDLYIEVVEQEAPEGHLYKYILYTVADLDENDKDDAAVQAWLDENDDADDPYEYVLYTYDEKVPDWYTYTGVQDYQLVAVKDHKDNKAATCLETGIAVYTYTPKNPKTGEDEEPIEIHVVTPKLKIHTINIDGKTYFMIDSALDTEQFKDATDAYSIEVLEKAGFLTDNHYFDQTFYLETGIAVYYIDGVNIFFTTNNKVAESCASDLYSLGWFTCDVEKGNTSHNGVTTINVREYHKAGDKTATVLYTDEVFKDIYSGADTEKATMLTASNWNVAGVAEDSSVVKGLAQNTVYTISGGCEDATYTVYVCTVCGEVIVEQTKAAQGHDITGIVTQITDAKGNTTNWTQPTATTAGLAWIICTRGDLTVEVTLPAYGTDYDNLPAGYTYELVSAATCAKTGRANLTYTYKYDGKDYTITFGITLEKTAHTFTGNISTWIVCEVDGTLYTYTGEYCSVCGNVIAQSKKELGYVGDHPDVAIDLDLRRGIVVGEETSVSLPSYTPGRGVDPVVDNLQLIIEEDGWYKVSVVGEGAWITVVNGYVTEGARDYVVLNLKAGSYGVFVEAYNPGDAVSVAVTVEATKNPNPSVENSVLKYGPNTLEITSSFYYCEFSVSETAEYDITLTGATTSRTYIDIREYVNGSWVVVAGGAGATTLSYDLNAGQQYRLFVWNINSDWDEEPTEEYPWGHNVYDNLVVTLQYAD